MRSFKLLIFVLYLIIGSFPSYATEYPLANDFQFPVENYQDKKNNNHFGACGKVYKCPIKHLGDDVSVAAETEVRSPGNGIVRKAYNSSSYGGVYLIEHDTGREIVVSLIAHMNYETFTKREGQTVGKNEYIGEIGTTKQNGGWQEHLHYEIRKGAYIRRSKYYYCHEDEGWIWRWAYLGYSKKANYTETTKTDYDVNHDEMVSHFYDPTKFIVSHQLTNYTPVKFTDSNTTYLYSNGQLWPIPDETTYVYLGFRNNSCGMAPDWSQVVELPISQRSSYIIRSELVAVPGIPPYHSVSYRVVNTSCHNGPIDSTKLYALITKDGVTRFHHISSWDVYIEMGYSENSIDIVDISLDLFYHYGEGESIEEGNLDTWITGRETVAGKKTDPINYVTPTPVPFVYLPYFEDFDGAHGLQLENHDKNASMLISNYEGVNGGKCLTVKNIQPGQAHETQIKRIGWHLENDGPYSVSVWLKAEQPGMAYVTLLRDVAPWDGFGLWLPVYVTTQWQKFDFQFSTIGNPAANPEEVRFTIMLGELSGQIWLDQISIKPSVTVSFASFPYNENFEHSSTGGFQLEDHKTAALMYLSSNEGINNSHCLVVENHERSEFWQVQAKKIGFEIQEGVSYHGRIFIRGSGSGIVYIGLLRNVAPWDGLGLWKELHVTTEWQEIDLVFKAIGTAEPENVRLSIMVGGIQGKILIDGLELR